MHTELGTARLMVSIPSILSQLLQYMVLNLGYNLESPEKLLIQWMLRPYLTWLFLSFFFFFLSFLGLLPRHMEVSRLEVESEL